MAKTKLNDPISAFLGDAKGRKSLLVCLLNNYPDITAPEVLKTVNAVDGLSELFGVDPEKLLYAIQEVKERQRLEYLTNEVENRFDRHLDSDAHD